jgi:hypothetical protein
MISMASTSQEQEAVVLPVNVDVRNSEDIVDFLINKCRFCKLSYEDKIYIKQLKRPCPDLSKTLVTTGKQNRAFNNSWYGKYDWLVGSKLLKKLFCWPCILFVFVTNNETVWTKTGYSDLKNLGRALEKHNKSKEHIASACKLVLFGKQNIATVIDTARKMEIEKFNINVRENREIIKSLIDIAIFLCKQELSFRGHDEGKGSSNRGNFKELVSLFSKRDVNLKKFVEKDTDSKSVFYGTSKTIQNELIDSINYVLNKKN